MTVMMARMLVSKRRGDQWTPKVTYCRYFTCHVEIQQPDDERQVKQRNHVHTVAQTIYKRALRMASDKNLFSSNSGMLGKVSCSHESSINSRSASPITR